MEPIIAGNGGQQNSNQTASRDGSSVHASAPANDAAPVTRNFLTSQPEAAGSRARRSVRVASRGDSRQKRRIG
jgi:hypothetical protein